MPMSNNRLWDDSIFTPAKPPNYDTWTIVTQNFNNSKTTKLIFNNLVLQKINNSKIPHKEL